VYGQTWVHEIGSTLFRTAFRAAGTLTATAILIFSLIIAVSGAFTTRNEIRRSFDRERGIQSAQLALEELLKVQLDEETAVRGYAITRDSGFLDPYYNAFTRNDPLRRQLAETLRNENLQQGQDILAEFGRIHDEWHRVVAIPLIENPRAANLVELEKRGKALIDQERADSRALKAMLAQRNLEVGQQTQAEINRTLYTRAGWVVVFGLLAILFNAYRARLNRELEEERTTTEILQRAFQSRFDPLPKTNHGSFRRRQNRMSLASCVSFSQMIQASAGPPIFQEGDGASGWANLGPRPQVFTGGWRSPEWKRWCTFSSSRTSDSRILLSITCGMTEHTWSR